MKFSRRLIINSSLLVGFALITIAVWVWSNIGMAPTAIYTGTSLLGITVFLALFNLRKKLPFLPLLKASTWMQFHIYIGLFSVLVFLLHIGFHVRSGTLEITLAILFALVAISGVFGLFLTRSLPKTMNQSGEAVSYEQIPRRRKEIYDKVQALVEGAEESCESSTLPEFYLEHLNLYLKTRPSVIHSFGPKKRRYSHRLENELQARMRYLSEDEILIAKEITEWISAKENLDFQDASHRLLKGWLFIHIPLTWGLILLGTVHGILALLYGGSS
ncbi:MAG: hypothetical protein GXP30_10235 [Verrucomicrobia bacterium]|nr:hypothetical protein [Verrucomicrobiota bacterium]